MKINKIEKLEKSIVELEIAVEETVFKKAVDEAFAKNAAKINVPGFRKGKAPRSIIEKMYGKGTFFEDAINATYGEAYDAAVKEAGLDPVAKGEVEIVKVDDTGYVFSAKIPVRPEVTLGEYIGVKASKPAVKVTDEQIEAELERVRSSQAREISIDDRPAKKGDIVIMNFEGFVDGKAFDGGKAEDYRLVLGSGSFIPGFEEQLEGKNIGEDIEVNVAFPEEYQEKSLSGKPALFKCKINEIKFEELPEFDDDFAKDISEFETFEKYKASIVDALMEQATHRAEREAEQEIVEKIAEGMTAEIPDVMVEQQIDTMISEYENNMRQQGIDLKTYLQYIDTDMEKFRSTFKESAEKTVKARLALEAVVKAEKIAVDESEIEEEYKRIADSYKIELDQIKSFIPSEQLAQDIAVDKALKFVVAQAKITTKKAAKEKE